MTITSRNKLIDINELKDVSNKILEEAKRLGADEAEVSIDSHLGFNVNARGGDVETVEYNQGKSIDLRVFFGKRSGTAGLSDVRPEAIRAAVEAACHIAKYTDEDPASGLADKADLAFDYPFIELCYPWDLAVDKAIELACECERLALAHDKRIMSAESSSVSTLQVNNVYANSLGFIGTYPYTRHDINCILVAKQGDEMQRDYSYTVSTDPTKLDTIEKIAAIAAERTVRRLGAKKLPTMKAPVIYIAEEARGLLGHFASAIHGGNLYRKSSFLVDSLGKKIFPDAIQLKEYPHLDGALGSAPFDNEGVKTRDNIFIENGVLKNYALGAYSARKLGMKTTGNSGGMHNLTITTGKKSLESLIKTMGRGLLVTEMMGNGVNLLTGDYSRGVGGFWVENGEVQYPVHEITIAGKLQDIYARIAEVGNDVDCRGNIRTGSILIEEMAIAGM